MSIDLGLPTVGNLAAAGGQAGVPRLPEGSPKGTKKEYASDQEVRWCPGCGDYAVLAAVQGFLPELGLRKENIVFVSGIGCSSRFPYYLNTYGMHSIHGRAPAIATGLAASRPDLSIWVVTGDGDALSIGANHLVHALRRNVNIKILLFNNQIYGLTKGQYSPTSQPGIVTKSSPTGSVDTPFNPISLALGAEATFVARALDSDRASLTEVLRAAAEHRGTALVEIYQNCPIFNDGAFEVLKDRDQAAGRLLRLVHGQPIQVGDGASARVAVRTADGSIQMRPAAEVAAQDVLVHDALSSDPSTQFALSRLDDSSMTQVPVGIFRQVSRPTYDDQVREQLSQPPDALAALQQLVAGPDTWTVA